MHISPRVDMIHAISRCNNMIQQIELLKQFILDSLFPISCLGCGSENSWICRTCLEKISLKSEQSCPVCEKVTTPGGQLCFACRPKSSLKALWVAGSYQNRLLAKSIHLFKYRFIRDLGAILGQIMTRAMRKSDWPLPDIILPVPLSSRRLRWRGYNQSGLIGRYLSENLLPGNILNYNDSVLVRRRHTHPQMEIRDHRKRQQNLRGAFQVASQNQVLDKLVWLIDDVATTGSTLFECARTLRKSGAREVRAIVLARQEFKA